LLSVLDQPKGGDAGWREGKSTENLKKFPKAKGAQGRFAGKLSETSKPKDKTGGSETLPPQASDTSEEERVEKIPGGYIVRDANGDGLVYLYYEANETEALQANVLTEHEARCLAINVARLLRLVKHND
jgi:hypothetical protein